MGTSRKRRRLVAFRKQLTADEEMGRFGWLVGILCVVEIAVIFWIIGGARVL